MKEKEKGDQESKETKQRIFDAAKSLFARKGFSAVSVREIAEKSKANISMLSYYYGGKVGLLQEIINEFNKKYYDAVLSVDIEKLTVEEVIESVIKNLVEFYRKNTELAVATHNTFAIDMPEIADLEVKWVSSRRKQLNRHFKKFGLDVSDNVLMSVMRGLLTAIISTHFISVYEWEYTKESIKKTSKETRKFAEEEGPKKLDDEFYEKYAEKLKAFYLHGLYGLTEKK
jgi:AcrR family transcriptional regulator